MKAFAQYLAAACIGLLSWQQATASLYLEAASVILISAGALAVGLTLSSNRFGYALDALLGIAYLAELLVTVRPADLRHVQPILLWSVLLSVCGFGLLLTLREKKPTKPLYERHPEY